MQNDVCKSTNEVSWQDARAAMEAQATQQGIQSQAKTSAEIRDENVTSDRLFNAVSSNGFRCALSGVILSPDDSSLDHSIPLSQGGAHVMSNINVVHLTVNRMKGEMNQSEFVRWCKLIAQWNG